MICESLATLQPAPPHSRQKVPFAVEELTKLAERMEPGAKLPSARALSEALGITGATLSRALKQLEGRHILRCRQGSGIYVGEGIGRKRVGLLLGFNIFSPDASPFGALIVQHSSQRANRHNERVSFYIDTPGCRGIMAGVDVPAPQDLVDALREGKLDGIILAMRSSEEQEIWLRGFGIPVVGVETNVNAVVQGRHVVVFDYEALIRQGIQRLKEIGCGTVGLIGAVPRHEEMFLCALEDAGLPVSELRVLSPDLAASRHANGRVAMGRHLGEVWLGHDAPLPDGLLFTDDMMARGALPVIERGGLLSGTRPLAICSHVNAGAHVLDEWNGRIQTVKFNIYEVAETLCKMLALLMEGREVSSPHMVSPIID